MVSGTVRRTAAVAGALAFAGGGAVIANAQQNQGAAVQAARGDRRARPLRARARRTGWSRSIARAQPVAPTSSS